MTDRSRTILVDIEAWKRWRRSLDGTRTWAAWSTDRPALLGWQTRELIAPAGSAATDAMQAALVALAQSGEGHAATTLLVQLRPGLLRLCRWAVATGRCPTSEAVDEVRAVFFETLYRHDLERRPAKIAANLVLDTRQRVTRASSPSPGGTSASVGLGWTGLPDARAGHHPNSQGDDDLLSSVVAGTLLWDAVHRLPGSDSSRSLTANVAYRAWILDQSRAEIAAALGLPRSAVVKRLHRLRAAIRRDDLSEWSSPHRQAAA